VLHPHKNLLESVEMKFEYLWAEVLYRMIRLRVEMKTLDLKSY